MTVSSQAIAIRDLRTIDELNQMRVVEKEVWGMAGEDAIPLTIVIALKAAGNIFIGAFEEKQDGGKHARPDTGKEKLMEKEKSEKDKARKRQARERKTCRLRLWLPWARAWTDDHPLAHAGCA